MSTAFPVLTRSDHKLLRSESCSGYTDVFGIWNTGFYCPQSESKAAVYCCGTETYKYCCTAKDPNDDATTSSEVAESNADSLRGALIIGTFAILFLAFFITLATCFFCPCCLFHKKRSSHTPNGLYRLQCGTSSTTSPLVNINSHSSNLSSFTRHPLDYSVNGGHGNGNGNGMYGHPNPRLQNNGLPAPTNYLLYSQSTTLPHPTSNNYSNPPQLLYDHFSLTPSRMGLILENNRNLNPPQLSSPAPNYFATTAAASSPNNRNSTTTNSNPEPYSTFLPRCRSSYPANELSGSPIFSTTHLAQQETRREEMPMGGIGSGVVYPSATTMSSSYNYANPGSRNSYYSNEDENFSVASTLPLYHHQTDNNYPASNNRNGGVGGGGVENRNRLQDNFAVEKKEKNKMKTPGRLNRSLDGYSKSVHFADSNPVGENENGYGTGNSIRRTSSTTAEEDTSSTLPISTIESTTVNPQMMMGENDSETLPPFHFEGIQSSSNFRSNERPVSRCEILTVL